MVVGRICTIVPSSIILDDIGTVDFNESLDDFDLGFHVFDNVLEFISCRRPIRQDGDL